MQYIVAMIFAVAGAGLAGRFLSGPVASWVSTSFVYTSPDGQNDMEQLAFIGVLLAGLLGGWAVGWLLASPFGRRERIDDKLNRLDS